ncbi:MAG: molybdenum cofactor biosynthesis protein B, partial [Candidatus Promineifilaceae bacterium]
MIQVGILTISDRSAAGEYKDQSGPLMAQLLSTETDWEVSMLAVVPDEQDTIARILKAWCDEDLNLILTSGGTGFAPRDITPEATRQVIEREAPGIAEALRA